MEDTLPAFPSPFLDEVNSMKDVASQEEKTKPRGSNSTWHRKLQNELICHLLYFLPQATKRMCPKPLFPSSLIL